MNTGKSSDDFFIFPRVRRADEILHGIKKLEKLLPVLAHAQQDAFKELLKIASELSPHAFQVQHLSPLEFFLLTALIEINTRMQALEKREWIHPPFP